MKVAIAGYGLEGKVSADYYHAQGHEVVILDRQTVADLPEGMQGKFGEDVLGDLSHYDIVVRTPGINPARLASAKKIWSATNEFFVRCPAPIIGVTGTKGKGTTASLIAAALEATGKTVHLVGNIGRPALLVLPSIAKDDIVVYELSSFQLWDLERSPHVAVILMLAKDHQDVHVSMADYIAAKANITRFQSTDDLLIHHPTNPLTAQIAAISAARKIPYLQPPGAEVIDGFVTIESKKICRVKDIRLVGAHNIENVCAAVTVSWQFSQDISAIAKGITSFAGLPHRLEFVAEVDGVSYYNDSQATIAEPTIAAIESFSVPQVIILGGSDKGTDISGVIKKLDPTHHFVVLIGKSSADLRQKLQARHFSNFIELGAASMDDIVTAARQHAQPGGVVLLSPAHASYDMFTSYKDRGDQFKASVKRLLQEFPAGA